MHAPEGHVNGTPYVVCNLGRHILDLEVATGPHEGKKLLLPRIYHDTQESYFCSFTRKQFPVKLAFAKTANKSRARP